jgi:transcriptional regulator with XRE-family HTH domain
MYFSTGKGSKMRQVLIGEYIRTRRQELGLTQEQLSEGICDCVTISRIETGKQIPSKSRVNAIMQRLGLSDDKYFALMSKNEMEIEALHNEIVSCNIHNDTERGIEKIAELEAIVEEDDHIVKQFILRSKALLGTSEGTFSFDEKLSMLMEAIRLTAPKFDIDTIEDGLYSLEEIKTISNIAKVYAENGDCERAVKIHSQLLNYVKKHYSNVLESGGYLPFVAHNYSVDLANCKRYEEALEIADLGWQSCTKYGHYQCLPGLIAVKAECYYFMGEYEKSKDLYLQAYYLYKAIGNEKSLEVIKNEAKERLNMEFDS